MLIYDLDVTVSEASIPVSNRISMTGSVFSAVCSVEDITVPSVSEDVITAGASAFSMMAIGISLAMFSGMLIFMNGNAMHKNVPVRNAILLSLMNVVFLMTSMKNAKNTERYNVLLTIYNKNPVIVSLFTAFLDLCYKCLQFVKVHLLLFHELRHNTCIRIIIVLLHCVSYGMTSVFFF